MSNPADIKYMSRAIQLAQQGAGMVSPNPMVGCVIVQNDRIIGEGYHHEFGGPHAEVEAIQKIADQRLLTTATAYVTLEPCSHFGKTPPCSDLLINHQLKRVVISNVDPNPLVQGRGIKKMKEAGIEVITGVLEKEAAQLNRRFFTFHQKGRPYIILKWAQTADGYLARKNFDSKWISSIRSRQLVHKWRAEEAAILVGKNTAFYDDPSLTTREWGGYHPIRIVLDHKGVLPDQLRLFQDGLPTLRFINGETGRPIDVTIKNESGLPDILKELFDRKIQSVIVEGGASTLRQFIDLGLWDEARIFKAPVKFDEGIKAPTMRMDLASEVSIGKDKLHIYENQEN